MAEPACMSQMVYLGPRQHTVGSSEELAGVIYQFVKKPGPYPRHGVLATNQTKYGPPLEMSHTYTQHREASQGRTFCHTKFLRPTN